jgi:hypothetical protein
VDQEFDFITSKRKKLTDAESQLQAIQSRLRELENAKVPFHFFCFFICFV